MKPRPSDLYPDAFNIQYEFVICHEKKFSHLPNKHKVAMETQPKMLCFSIKVHFKVCVSANLQLTVVIPKTAQNQSLSMKKWFVY